MLLCCDRYISTLFAHEHFPNITHAQVQRELKDSVTKGWKWKLLNSATYVTSMVAKYKQGQPVSFTDFFGHLLGDVLLKDVSVCVFCGYVRKIYQVCTGLLKTYKNAV